MYASYCSSLKDNTALSKEEISRNILAYNAVVRATIEAKPPARRTASTKSTEKKESRWSSIHCSSSCRATSGNGSAFGAEARTRSPPKPLAKFRSE